MSLHHIPLPPPPTEYFLQKDKEQRPIRQTLYGVLRRNSNLKCLILTFLIHGCLGAIIWCRNSQVTKILLDFDAFPITRTRQVSPCDDGVIYIPTAFVIMLYFLYLVECWHSKARIQLSLPKTDVSSVYQMIREMREAQPRIWWKAICYHYIRRIRQVTRVQTGSSYTSSQVFYERVNTHAVASYFFYTLCGMRDVSRDLQDLEKYPATKIRLSKDFLFANIATAAEFEEQRSAFFQEQGRLDDYMEMRESLELSNTNFKESLMAWTHPECLPWFARNNIFWIFSFLLLSWPIRILLELNTAQLNYTVTKLFGSNYQPTDTLPLIRPMTLDDPIRFRTPSRHTQYYRRLSSGIIPSHPSRVRHNSIPSWIKTSTPCIPLLRDEGDDRDSLEAKGRRPGHVIPRSLTLMTILEQPKTQKIAFMRHLSPDEEDEDQTLIPTYSEACLLHNHTPSRLQDDLTLQNPSWNNSHQEILATEGLHSGNNDRERTSSRINSNSAETATLTTSLLQSETNNNNHDMRDRRVSSNEEMEAVVEPFVHQDGIEEPPSYLEALRTSRPVFIPPLARLRRCLTERDLSCGVTQSRDSNWRRRPWWLQSTPHHPFRSRFLRIPFMNYRPSDGRDMIDVGDNESQSEHDLLGSEPRVEQIGESRV